MSDFPHAADDAGRADDELVITTAKITPNVVKPTGTSISYFLANEDPANWQPAAACPGDPASYCVSFPKPVGRTVRWKATMCSNATKTVTPRITGVSIAYDYTVAENHFRGGAVSQDDVTYVGAFHDADLELAGQTKDRGE